MGADIYIRSLSDAGHAKYSKKFDEAVMLRDKAQTAEEREAAQKLVSKYYEKMYARGYFRDSYNATSLFWILGLSWWNDTGNELDEEGRLSVAGCKKLLAEVKGRAVPSVKQVASYLAGQNAAVDDGENSPAEWRKFFVNKRRRFIRFLEKAIELNEGLDCSI